MRKRIKSIKYFLQIQKICIKESDLNRSFKMRICLQIRRCEVSSRSCRRQRREMTEPFIEARMSNQVKQERAQGGCLGTESR